MACSQRPLGLFYLSADIADSPHQGKPLQVGFGTDRPAASGQCYWHDIPAAMSPQKPHSVREADEQNAISALLRPRADLQAAATIELRGQADQAFIEWVQPDRDVFQVMVVS